MSRPIQHSAYFSGESNLFEYERSVKKPITPEERRNVANHFLETRFSPIGHGAWRAGRFIQSRRALIHDV